MKQWFLAKLLDFTLKKVFRTIDPKDLYRVEKGRTYALGRELREGEVERLKHDADKLQRSMIWRILTDGMEMEMQRKSIESPLASNSSRVGIHLVNTMKNIVRTLSEE